MLKFTNSFQLKVSKFSIGGGVGYTKCEKCLVNLLNPIYNLIENNFRLNRFHLNRNEVKSICQ